ADVYFQASIIADREGRWVLARSYAERAKSAYEELADRSNLGRLLNNLGGINFLLGHPDEALALLKDAVRIALEVGNDAEAAHAVNGIAQVHLRTGEIQPAEEQARYALKLLGDRVDEMHEIGNAQLVLGRALLAQDRLDEAEDAPKAGSLEALWRSSAQSVALIPGTSDYSPGIVRISFLVVDPRGRVVATPRARVWVARSLQTRPFASTVARLEPIGVPGVSTGA